MKSCNIIGSFIVEDIFVQEWSWIHNYSLLGAHRQNKVGSISLLASKFTVQYGNVASRRSMTSAPHVKKILISVRHISRLKTDRGRTGQDEDTCMCVCVCVGGGGLFWGR